MEMEQSLEVATSSDPNTGKSANIFKIISTRILPLKISKCKVLSLRKEQTLSIALWKDKAQDIKIWMLHKFPGILFAGVW